MQNITKKFIVSIVTIAFAATLGIPTTSAATAAELQAQINALLATIQALQAQLGTVQGTTGTGTGACAGISFTRTLKLGMSGTDVKCMQTILNQSADTQVSASGSGAPGYETTYFGAKTKAAVIVFQQKYASEVLTPVGLTAGTGLVGAKTVAKLNTLIGATGGTGGTGTVIPTLPTASGLSVALASDNAVAGTIISDGASAVAGSQALIPYLKLNFSTPAGTSAKVTTLKLQRLGVCSDTDIPNAYLFDGNTKVAEMTSLSLGVMTFVNPAGLFTVSGFKTLTVKADLYNDASAGKTIGLGVVSAASIVTDASAVNGTFPINGNLMTTAVVTDFGRLTVATTTNSATVDPGTTGWEAARINLTAANQKIKLYSIKFLQLGSVQKADIANLALYNGATQLGTTQASLASDGTVTFDLSSAPLEIAAGLTKTVALRIDVVGGSTRNIQFSLQRSSDIVAIDANYGVSVNPDTSLGTYSVLISTAASVTSGNLTISKSIDSPSGNVALSSTNVTLAKFDVKAVGEDIKVTSMVLKVASSSAATWNAINNVKLFYDGYQVGALVNIAYGTNNTIYPSFTVPAGQTKVLSIVADIQGGTVSTNGAIVSGSKITASLETGASNAQRMTSLGAFSFPSASNAGNELTVSAAALSVAKNYSVGNISTVYNVQGITIGSWLLTAGSAEGIDVSRLEVTDASTSVSTSTGVNSLGKAFTNLKMYYGSTQLGSTVVPGSGDAAQTKYSFYPSGFSLVAGQTVRLDLKADVLSTNLTWTNTNAVQLSAADGTGKITTNASNIGTAGAATGQGITLNSAGMLTGALDSSSPEASMVAMGDSAKVLGVWKLTADSIEDLTVSQIIVTNRAVATSSSNVGTMTLYCGDAQFGASQSGLIYNAGLYGGTYYAAFGSTAGTCIIPKGSSKTITLKGDITTYGAGAASGQYLQFALSVPFPINGNSTNDIIARGAGGYASTTARSTSTANPVYTYRTSLTSSLACNGVCTARSRSATDKIASLTLTGTALVDGLFRVGIDVPDDSSANASTNAVGGLDGKQGAYASDTCFYASTTALDGSYSIAYQASTSVATTTYLVINTGVDLNPYSKLSVWLYPHGTSTARTVFTAATSSGNAYAQRITSVSSGVLTIGKWNRVELDLVASSSPVMYVGVALPTQYTVNTNDNFFSSPITRILVDGVKAYNDSITVTLGGNASTSGNGQPIYLKTAGNTTKAADFYDSNNNIVELIPSAEIAVGSTPQTFDLISDTTTLIELGVSGISRTLSMSISLGSVSTAGVITAGGFRWYDQAVAATSPITWMGGASPISVTISLGSGI